ncbi:MAG: PKD domain-containing protein [Bacteroidota bacterium]|nr:PKD domain-containing protein [Bacteroidota bacterium]
MKIKQKFRNAFLLMLLLLGFNYLANAQCDISVNKTSTCRGSSITFKIPSTTTFSSIKWDFGDGDSSLMPVPEATHAFDTFGTFTACVYLYTSTGSVKCSDCIDVTIYDNPNADLILPSQATMCFENNYFCFDDNSTPGQSNAPIADLTWDVGDGNVYTNLTKPCHTYTKSGKYTILLQIADTNGCVDTASKVSEIVVLPKLAPKFETQFAIGCPETNVKFKNTTDTNGKNIVRWWWDFDDGSGDSTSADSMFGKPPFSHTYTMDGSFHPKLIIESAFGCVDSFINYSGAKNIFYWFDILKSQGGPVCWEGNELCFKQEPRPNAYYWLWVFDDPPSMLLNTNDESWEPCHHYTAPGFYDITLTIYEPNCIRDTTFCVFIPLKGPQAMITLPPPPAFPPNDELQAKPIPLSTFHYMSSQCWNPNGDPIDYVTRTSVPPFLVSSVDTYCNAVLDSINFDTTFKPYPCYDNKPPRIISINYPFKSPTGTKNFYDSVTETNGTWFPGDPLPNGVTSGNVYYPKSGTATPQTMHDTDLYIHNCSGPNYVRFTNNSKKYRLYYAIDDDPTTYTFPANDLSQDQCRNPSYPWASDSMEYWWDFTDGDQCTSTVAVPNMDCRYSDEVQPWHLFKEDGCYSVQLRVTDNVTNCVSLASVNIVMEPPDASWDEDKFTYLDWALQKVTPPALGRRGVILNGTPCVGQSYPQRPDFTETLPSCARQKWWMVFDSAAQCAANCSDTTALDTSGNGNADHYATHQTITCGWIDDITFMMMGNKWIYGDGGWKTIGLIIKTGDCLDTFFYYNYKYIFDLQAGFNLNDPYNFKYGEYLPMNYAESQHLRLCPPHQAILTVADTQQVGITKFTFMISKFYAPPWTKPIYIEDSCTLTKKDTIFWLCHQDSFTLDPFTGKKVFHDCFMYPDVTKGKPVNQNWLNNMASQGWFASDTFPQLTLQDSFYMKDTSAPYATRLEPNYSMSQPGKYYVISLIRNVYGCVNMGQAEVYVGHYTNFLADDRVICYEGGGDTVTFTHFIRYFQVQLQPWDPHLNQTPFWEDPIGNRPWGKPTIIEKVEFDCDGDGVFETNGIKDEDSVTFIYDTPGDYTVSMRTTDSNGCVQVLERKAFIKVIGVVADFADTNTSKPYICGPKLIGFNDMSYGLNNYGYVYYPNGTVKDSFLIDSVYKWKWEFGDELGSRSLSYIEDPLHTYLNNGNFDVMLIVENTNGCVDTIMKPNFIELLGPEPKFHILKNGVKSNHDTLCAGDYLIVKDSSMNLKSWEFNKGDNTTASFTNYSNSTDSTFEIQYTQPGVYYISLIASDSVYNPAVQRYVPCTSIFADSSDQDDPHFIVTVLPIPRTKFSGDTLICDSTTAVFDDLSDTGYQELYWNFGDGTDHLDVPGKTVYHVFTTMGSDDTTYTVKLDGYGNSCPDKQKSIQIRVMKTVADIGVVDSSGLPEFTFTNKSTGATNYKWTVEGIDTEKENTDYYKEFTTMDTSLFVNDFGNEKGDFRVCLYSWINNPNLDPASEGCLKKECVVINNYFSVKIHIPNIFTPEDKNSTNDEFTIENEGVELWDITIFNRWGEKVFESTDPNVHWNGDNMNSGQACAGGTYYYVINYQLRGKKMENQAGSVTLIR